MGESKPDNQEDFAKNKITVCQNCRKLVTFFEHPVCFGTEKKDVFDFVSGENKTLHYDPKRKKYYDSLPLCSDVNKGNCSYYEEQPKRQGTMQKITKKIRGLFRRSAQP